MSANDVEEAKPRLIRVLVVSVIIAAATVLAISSLGMYAHDATLHGWYDNASGYRQAQDEQRRTGKPIAVYFYTDWCESCKKLRETVLTASEAKTYLSNYLTVKIDLEAGAEEEQLGREFGVVGFPAFYIKAHPERRAVNILRTTELTLPQFITLCDAERVRQAI